MDKFTNALYIKYTDLIIPIVSDKRYLRQETKSIFESLIKRIYVCEIKIYNYVKDPLRKKNLVFTVNTKNLELSFTLKPDLTSIINIKYIEKNELIMDDSLIENNFNTSSKRYVYFVKSDYGFKIGKTKDIKQRLNTFGIKLPFDVNLFSFIETTRMDDCELFFHKLFEDRRINGEWFNLSENDFVTIDILSKKFGTYTKIKQ